MRSLSRTAAAISLLLASPAFSQDQPAATGEPAAATAAPAEGAITVELNKMVPVENACHIYFVVNNGGAEPLGELQVDVYLFDKQGVILRGVAFQFLDLRPARSRVAAFELPDLPCSDVGRVLLNKVLTCTDAAGAAIEGCGDRIAVSTRTEAAFEI
jgi:hypothetical protein